MKFFKIVVNNKIIDIACSTGCMRWSVKGRRFLCCDENHMQYLQSSLDEERIYHADWMWRPESDDGVNCVNVDVIEIEEGEYHELEELLTKGEELDVPAMEAELVLPVLEEPIPEAEKPPTIMQMREMIEEQQKQIQALMDSLEKLQKTK